MLKKPESRLHGQPVIIGSGIAGLMTALMIRRPCIILSPGAPAETTSSYLAQGGMAAAIGPDDSLEQHIADTIAAGAGLCDPEAVRAILTDTQAVVAALERFGVSFTRRYDGTYYFHREAAHSRARILHAQGDGSGRAMMEALMAAAARSPDITFLHGRRLTDIATQDGHVAGLWLEDGTYLPTTQCILASGGASGLFPVSTNPRGHDGGPIAMALRIGARVMDLEFTQFHPTALAIGAVAGRHFLISEAVRGAGAVLVNEKGGAFTDPLQPRDIVARAVAAQEGEGHKVYLDARGLFPDGFGRHYPTIYRLCRQNHIDPDRERIPVTPAAHYLMGGLQTDLTGRTHIGGLWACGEVAATGLHGANRLASNSLVEACVMASRVGRALQDMTLSPSKRGAPRPPPVRRCAADVRAVMGQHLGLLRDGRGLAAAHRVFSADMAHDDHALIGAAMAYAAFNRKESRGSHYRVDAQPATPPRHSVLTIDDLKRTA
ncbi:L-aspartate oxidase [Acetobacteraceae bacterium EV16G]|uniref:L-aspartate oxidase n=1 Tax=Sorlinia euscelidii TaxID=3081148 RepID=A0ABU7TY86_9PROT